MKNKIIAPVFAAFLAANPAAAQTETEAPEVEMQTTLGAIVIRVDEKLAPLSAANFLQYVDDGFFDGLVFHRVIPGFMVQGGGFTPDMKQQETREPIQNEATNGRKNLKYTLAMARTPAPHSATAQFFINVADNAFLDHTAPTDRGFGYAVFGEVVSGMEVVDAITQVKTGNAGPHQNVPTTPVIINKAARK